MDPSTLSTDEKSYISDTVLHTSINQSATNFEPNITQALSSPPTECSSNMNTSEIVVKEEKKDDDEENGVTKLEVDNATKQQKPIESIAASIQEDPMSIISTTTAKATASFTVKSEPLEEEQQHQDFRDEISPSKNFSQSFLTSELCEGPTIPLSLTTAITSITTTTTTTTNERSKTNTKLHKKRKLSKSIRTRSASSSSSPMTTKKPAVETDVADTTTVSSTASTTKTMSPPTLLTASQKPASIELKVKCPCRLGTSPVPASVKNVLKLKKFFVEMFEKTRELSLAQQREVKMAMLKAISEAEDDMDAGRWCDQCCS